MSDMWRVILITASTAFMTLGSEAARGEPVPAVPAPLPTEPVSVSRRVRMDTIARTGNTFSARLEGGATAELTLDARLQDTAEVNLQLSSIKHLREHYFL